MVDALSMPLLIVEQDRDRLDALTSFFSTSKHHRIPFNVHAASTESEAKSKIERVIFPIMLVGLPKNEICSEQTLESLIHSSDTCALRIAQRLLEYHRTFHEVKPRDAKLQLRFVLYFWEEDRLSLSLPEDRILLLSEGASAVVSCRLNRFNAISEILYNIIDMQDEILRIAEGKSWLSKISDVLDCGVSIIDKNWKIWSYNKKIAKMLGLRPDGFLDNVCWREMHGFTNRNSPCPECPASIVMNSHLCALPNYRDSKCITDLYPFPIIQRQCEYAEYIGDICRATGKELHSYTNCRLLPINIHNKPQLKWIHVIASPIRNREDREIIGAVELVIDLHELYSGHWTGNVLLDQLSPQQLMLPALIMAHWLGYNEAAIYQLSKDYSYATCILHASANEDYAIYDIIHDKAHVHTMNDVTISKERVTQILASGDSGLVSDRSYAVRLQNTGENIGILEVYEQHEGQTLIEMSKARNLLKAVAAYLGDILSLHIIHEEERIAQQHSDAFRQFEEKVNNCQFTEVNRDLESREKQLHNFLRETLKEIFVNEHGLSGFHLRYQMSDCKLHLYPGLGPYGLVNDLKAITVADESSYSAKCFYNRSVQVTNDVESVPMFKMFMNAMAVRKDKEGKNAYLWCKNIRGFAWFPIFYGGTSIGTLAIQSNKSDYFSTETMHYYGLLCNVIARLLYPFIEARRNATRQRPLFEEL